MKITKAVILAGGEGTRLRPLTYTVPKAMIPVQGKTLTEHVLDILKKFGVREVVLGIGYMADQVQEYFGDGSKFGLKIEYTVEKERMGTAGPLILMKPLDETFITVNGDNLFNLDFNRMLKVHRKNRAIATDALTKADDPSHFGVARMQGDIILEFIEKPPRDKAPSNLINSGYYILEPDVFDMVKGRKFVMLEKDIFPELARKGKLFGYYDAGQWFDTGTPERYEQVKKEWKPV